jgi:hypothetical protein
MKWRRNRFGDYISGAFAITPARRPMNKWLLWRNNEFVDRFNTLAEAKQKAKELNDSKTNPANDSRGTALAAAAGD